MINPLAGVPARVFFTKICMRQVKYKWAEKRNATLAPRVILSEGEVAKRPNGVELLRSVVSVAKAGYGTEQKREAGSAQVSDTSPAEVTFDCDQYGEYSRIDTHQKQFKGYTNIEQTHRRSRLRRFCFISLRSITQNFDFAPAKILRGAFFACHPRAQRRILAKNACSRMTAGASLRMTLGGLQEQALPYVHFALCSGCFLRTL